MTATPLLLAPFKNAALPIPAIRAAWPEGISPSLKYFKAGKNALPCSNSARLFPCKVRQFGRLMESVAVTWIA